MDKNKFRYTLRKYNVEKDRWYENQAIFDIKEIATEVPKWVYNNFAHMNQVKSINQCTGVLDVNSDPIFENDNVKDLETGIVCIVQFFEGSFCSMNLELETCYELHQILRRWEIINE